MTRRAKSVLWIVGPLVVASVLRAWNLWNQPLLDDELALVRSVLSGRPLALFWSYGHQDVFRALASAARVLLDLGIPLREWLLRLPSVLAGLLAVVLIPRAARHTFGQDTAAYLAWLLAVSPLLVLYSRLVRSYMPMTLCASLAILWLVRGLETGNRRTLLSSCVAMSCAVFFHVMALPFLVSAFAAAAVVLARDRSPDGRALQRSFDVSLLAALGVGVVLIGPSLPSFAETMAVKTSGASISIADWGVTSLYLAGSRSVLFASCFWFLVGLGGLLLARRSGRIAVILGAALISQPLALALISPFGANHDLVLSRYVLVELPIALLLVAVALGHLQRNLPSDVRRLGAPVIATAALLVGPLPTIYAGNSSLAHHTYRMRFVRDATYLRRDLPPILDTPILRDARTIVWIVPRLASESFPSLQWIDKRLGGRIILADLTGLSGRDGLAFRNSISLTPAALRDVRADAMAITLREFPFLREKRRRYYVYPALKQKKRQAILKKLVARFGPPDRADDDYAVWDLHREAPMRESVALPEMRPGLGSDLLASETHRRFRLPVARAPERPGGVRSLSP